MGEQEIRQWLGDGYDRWRNMSEAEKHDLVETLSGILNGPPAHAAKSITAQDQLDFVLKYGLPMQRSGKYRYHGIEPIAWHDTMPDAIRAAILHDAAETVPVPRWTREQVAQVREDGERLHAKFKHGRVADPDHP